MKRKYKDDFKCEAPTYRDCERLKRTATKKELEPPKKKVKTIKIRLSAKTLLLNV